MSNVRSHSSIKLAPALLLLLSSSVGLSQPSAPVEAQQHLQRAHVYLSERKPQAAIPEFRAVLASDPNNLDATGNLGVLLYFDGDYADAEPLLRRTITAQPVPKLQALLGLCERHLGNTDAAQKDLASALPGLEDPAIRREAGLQLIEIQTASGDLPEAAATVSQLKAKAPEDPMILYAAYRVFSDLAGEAMLDLSVAAPKSAQMHQAMAHELLRTRDVKGAIANYRLALVADPGLPGIHYELAEALRGAAEPGLKAEAEAQYELARKENPSDAKSLTRLADIEAERGDHIKATVMYTEARRLSPASADAGLGLAHEMAEAGDLASSLKILLALEQADPTDVLVHFRLSALYRRLQRPAEAKQEIAQYQKYKEMKEKLRSVYKEMRLDEPGASPLSQ